MNPERAETDSYSEENPCTKLLKYMNNDVTNTRRRDKSGKFSRAENSSPPKCTECGAENSPQWRRSIFGTQLCNRCGYKEYKLLKRSMRLNTGSKRNSPKVVKTIESK